MAGGLFLLKRGFSRRGVLAGGGFCPRPILNTYKTVTRSILEYGGAIYGPAISTTQMTHQAKLSIQDSDRLIADTSNNHLHDETQTLTIKDPLRLHSSHLRQKSAHPNHPLHQLTKPKQPPKGGHDSNSNRHDAKPLFNYPNIPTSFIPEDMWTIPVGVAALLDVWGRSWAGPE